MKKIAILLVLLICGCGSSGGGNSVPSSFDFDGVTDNFITSTVTVERQFLYLLNRGDNTLSAFLIDGEEEEEGGHAHGRILAQEEEAELALTELDGSPYPLSAGNLVDIAVNQEGRYLVSLDSSGTLRSYGIDGVSGLITLLDERTTGVTAPRRMEQSYDGSSLGVLGEVASLHKIDADGNISNGALVLNTQTWTGLAVNGNLAVGATPIGAASFVWSPGFTSSLATEVPLPGATRGEVTYSESGVWVVNRDDGSVSNLAQEADGSLTLTGTFSLPASLSQPRLLSRLFGGEDLGVADDDTFVLLHPGDGMLETGAEADLPRGPNRIFEVPNSTFVLLGHDSDVGSTVLNISDGDPTNIEVHDEPGPGGDSPSGFGYSSRVSTITQTSKI